MQEVMEEEGREGTEDAEKIFTAEARGGTQRIFSIVASPVSRVVEPHKSSVRLCEPPR